LGVGAILAACWACSEKRTRFPWRLATGAFAAQLALIILIFGLPQSRIVLSGASAAVDALAASTQAGVQFVFGFLAGGEGQPYPVKSPAALFVFAFHVLPVILVICALSALLWHWRVLRWLTQGFGFVFERTLGLRGAPALAAAATVFMGQVEGPIFIRSYLPLLSRSELFLLLTVGMSCVSGSTVVAYATILKGVLPDIAAHILAASLISAPAGILLARILVPRDAQAEAETDFQAADSRSYDSAIDAVMKGTGDGLNIVLNVAATLVVVVALAAMVNGLLGLAPPVAGARLSLERIFGWLFAPLAFLIGIPWTEAPTAGALLGEKLVLTEFTAFSGLAQAGPRVLSERTRMILTYALCGFANIASVGINVAGYSILAPERRGEVLTLVWRAMAAGFLATCMTAALVGALPRGLYPH
jgi:CNT family concentrative nucleoside transporter